MKYSFKELINIAELQELTDEFSNTTSMPSAIVGMDGKALTESGFQRICTDFHRQHPEVQKECIKSDTKIRKKLDKGEGFVMYKCPRGLVDASSPIIIDGEHVANVFSGQVFLEPPDNTKEQFFRAQAREFGFDEIEYIRAFREVPVFTEKNFRSALFFLAKLAQMIAKMGYIRLNELESAKALQESEGRLKSLFEESADAVLIYRDGLFADCNQAAVDMLRLETKKQVLNCTPADISPELQPDGSRSKIKSVEMVELATTQGYHRFEWTHRRADGEEFPVEVMMTSMKKHGSHFFHVVLRDITENKEDKEKLEEIETRYQILTNQFADGIAIIQNDRYQFVNRSFSSMAGYDNPEHLIGKKYKQFISKDFIRQYNESIIFDTDADGVQNTIDYKFLSVNGTEIWVEEKRNEINWNFAPALLCTLRDITEIKQREASSKEETKQLRHENIQLKSSLKERYRFQNIIGISPAMQSVYDQILSAANSDAAVSISGESGTGKELVAKAIHDLSNRVGNSFVAINCGAIPEPLLESEFFGYKKGAFTGAVIDKHGFLDLADNGTLFLDEVGELSLSMQVKLLRAIDGGGYNPIGSNEKCTADFRIISATNQDLKAEVFKGNMREDFYYRIQVIPIKLPPLRERKEDIPFLVEHFTQLFSDKNKFGKIPDQMMGEFYNYTWAGNVR
jgi:PAS domain S-box-containing protein